MDSRIDRQRGIVAEHIRRENEHDWPGVHDTFVQDDRAYYEVVPLGTRFKGIEGVRSTGPLLLLCPIYKSESFQNMTCLPARFARW